MHEKTAFFLFRPITALYTKNCPQNCLKKVSFSKLPQITFFALITTKMKLLGHFQTLWTLLQSHEAMNLTLVQFFWQTRQNFMTSQKDTFFLYFVGGQTFKTKVKEAQEVCAISSIMPKMKPIMNHKSYNMNSL